MINAKEHVKLHNRFDLQLIDSRSGEVKQEAHAENVVLNSFWTGADYMNTFLVGIQLGTGSGTPSPSDTSLFNYAFTSRNSAVSYSRVSRTIAWPTSTLVGAYTFPASSSFVGNLTEIGVIGGGTGTYSSTSLITHAMLVDSEGNPISINKTELDILIVTVTLYLTLSSQDESFNIDKKNNAFQNSFTDVYVSDSYIAKSIALYTCATRNAVGGVVYPGSTRNWTASTKTLSITGTRLGTGSGNTTYYNGIGITNHGWFTLPNSNIFTPYTVEGIEVGTGDGSTTEFDCPIPMFVKNTDVLYKNGTPLTRGVDYTIDNMQNKAALPCISTFNFAEVTQPADTPDGWSTHELGSAPNAPLLNDVATDAEGKAFWLKDRVVVHLDTPDPVVGNKINRLSFSGYKLRNSANESGYAYVSGKAKILFEYSTDGEAWQELATVKIDDVYNSYNGYTGTISFDTVSANYIRFNFVNDEDTALAYQRAAVAYPWANLYQSPGSIKAYYQGSPIVFTNPPADGDTITLDVTIDRPFKNSNFVMDSAMSIAFS